MYYSVVILSKILLLFTFTVPLSLWGGGGWGGAEGLMGINRNSQRNLSQSSEVWEEDSDLETVISLPLSGALEVVFLY